MARATNDRSCILSILLTKALEDLPATRRSVPRARLTKDSSGSIVTGKTGLTHARAVKISRIFDMNGIMLMQGCSLNASVKHQGCRAAWEDGEDLPIVDDESSNFV